MKPITKPSPSFLPLLISCFIPLCGYGATYYVSNTGNNNNAGTSWAQAWQTLHYAAGEVVAGDSVIIANGTYAGFDLRTSGTTANPIVFLADGNSVVINTPNPVTPDGINIENADYIEVNGVRVINQPRNGIRLVFADFCIVRNTYCDNNFERGIFTGFTDDILVEYNECLNSIDEHGIYISNSSDRSILRYNVCHHNNRGGIQINADESQGGDGISTDPEIYGNILYENGVAGGAAINLDGVQGAFIYNNLLYSNHATGIALFQQDGAEPSTGAVIVHNTILHAADARWCILAVNGSFGAQVFNNIIINQHPWRGSIALDPDAEPGFDSDYNIVVNSLSNQGDGESMTLAQWQALGYDTHSMLADPLADIFEEPGSADFHLADGSQAINTGNGNLAFGVDEDIEGTVRPQGSQHDIGAYEAEGALAIDEPSGGHSQGRPPSSYVLVENGKISWPDGLEGQLMLLTMEGKILANVPVGTAGEFSLHPFSPGVYVMLMMEERQMKWSRACIWTGR